MQVMDISYPMSPTLRYEIDTPGSARSVAVSGDHAFLVDSAGLRVIDMTTLPPQIVGNVDAPGVDVAVSGGHACVAGSGLAVIDVTDPTNPQIAGSVSTQGAAVSVDVSGSHAFVTDALGLRVIDLTDPAAPRIIGGADAVDWSGPWGVTVTNEIVIVADGQSGLQILPVQCEEPTDVPPESPPTAACLLPSYPNPFNPSTTIAFEVATGGAARLRVFDLAGRQVASLVDGVVPAGRHEVVWRGRDAQGRVMPSGTYIVRLETGSSVEAKKVMLVR
jgi:hypothetical protein